MTGVIDTADPESVSLRKLNALRDTRRLRTPSRGSAQTIRAQRVLQMIVPYGFVRSRDREIEIGIHQFVRILTPGNRPASQLGNSCGLPRESGKSGDPDKKNCDRPLTHARDHCTARPISPEQLQAIPQNRLETKAAASKKIREAVFQAGFAVESK